MLNTLATDMVERRSELHTIIEEKDKALKDAKSKGDKVAKLEAKNLQYSKRASELKALMKEIAKAHIAELPRLKE